MSSARRTVGWRLKEYSSKYHERAQDPNVLTSEEGLHHKATNPASVAIAENKASNVDNALAVRPELKLAILLANVVQANTHGDHGGLAGLESVCATADGCAVLLIAEGLWLDAAYVVVRTVVRGQVCVHLASTVFAPHEARREAAIVALPAGAAERDVVAVTTV